MKKLERSGDKNECGFFVLGFLVCLTFPIKFHEGKDLNLSKNFENSTHTCHYIFM